MSMQTIILAAGLGERFSQQGYPNPKPATMVDGKPMIVRVLEEVCAQSPIRVILNRMHRTWRIPDMINHAGWRGVHCIELPQTTRGPAETLYLGLEGVSDNDSVLVLDCDVLHPSIVTECSRNSSIGIIFCFPDQSQKSMFSYVSVDGNNNITEIAEKRKISNFACSGAYYFPNCANLKDACRYVMRMGETSMGEFYISNVVQRMITNGCQFKNMMYEPYRCLGTPEQLQSVCIAEQKTCENIRLCFDLDNTLVSQPKLHGDYSTVEPIEENIEFLRQAKERGAYIIIYTARRMRTHKGDVSKVIEDVGTLTRETLQKFSIPYDELHFGKPWANFYIDDLAVPAWQDIPKWTGIYPRGISARKHNKIDIKKDHVIKETGNLGEIYFYQNMPSIIKQFFPTIISIDSNTIKMDKITGEIASHMYCDGAMTTDDLENILDTIGVIHESATNCDNFDPLANYSEKLIQRSTEYNYEKLGLQDAVQKTIIDLDMLNKQRKINIGVIHGDPVFTNIFVGREIKFIDPRGKVGNVCTIFGDIMYDYAKIYQSLIGYDAVLLGKKHPKNNKQLIDFFFQYGCSKFSPSFIQETEMITKSLVISLLPMHDDNNVPKFVEFFKQHFTH